MWPFEPNVEKLTERHRVGALLRALRYQRGSFAEGVRARAAESLGTLADPRAIEPLILALKDEDDCVVEAAAKALVRIGDPRSTRFIAGALYGRFGFPREAMVDVLGDMKAPAAADALLGLLSNDRLEMRQKAVVSLDRAGWQPRTLDEKACYLIAKGEWSDVIRLGAPAVVPLTDTIDALMPALDIMDPMYHKQQEAARKAQQALERIQDPEAAQVLAQAARHKMDYVRQPALKALARLRTFASTESMINALQDEDYRIRQLAAQSLASCGDHRAVLPLVHALWHCPPGRWAAPPSQPIEEILHALAAVGDARAVPDLLKYAERESGKSRYPAACIRTIEDILGRHAREVASSDLNRIAEIGELVECWQDQDTIERTVEMSDRREVDWKGLQEFARRTSSVDTSGLKTRVKEELKRRAGA